jgi:putative glutamine amidotransferase
MKKPMIGVLPLWDEEKDSIWMLPGYMQGVEAAGGIPVILSLTADEAALQYWAESLDGFLFTGGQDVAPALYGEQKLPVCGELCPQRDIIEEFLFKTILELDRPAFGICRGLQFFNVALGGTLYQDISTQLINPQVHEGVSAKEIATHTVTIEEISPLYNLAGSKTCTVNSYHHQGIKDLAAGLCAAAACEDGLVESVYLPGRRFVLAVQWHPELNFGVDSTSMALFRAFIDAAK